MNKNKEIMNNERILNLDLTKFVTMNKLASTNWLKMCSELFLYLHKYFSIFLFPNNVFSDYINI